MIAQALFALALTSAAPATADPREAPATPPAAAPQAMTPNAATRYCVLSQVTGSRIPYRTCLTRKDWLKQGFDPLTAK
jgi:hypothetical protein